MIPWGALTHQNKKDTLVDAAARGRLTALLFHFLQKISPFPERMNPNLVITLSAVLCGPRSEYPKE